MFISLTIVRFADKFAFSIKVVYRHFRCSFQKGAQKSVILDNLLSVTRNEVPLRKTINSKQNLVWFPVGKMVKDTIFGVHLWKEHRKSLLTAYFEKANPSGNLTVAILIFYTTILRRRRTRIQLYGIHFWKEHRKSNGDLISIENKVFY